MIPALLIVAVLLALVYWLPGRLALELLVPKPHRHGNFAVAMGLGLVLVNVPALVATGLGGLFGPVYMNRPIVVVTSLVVSGILAAVCWRKGCLPRPTLPPTEPGRWAMAVLTLAAALFFIVYFDFDTFEEDSCIIRAASQVTWPFMDHLWPDARTTIDNFNPYFFGELKYLSQGRNPFITYYGGLRMGPGMLIPPLVGLFEVFGYRVCYALQGLLLPGLGYALGMALLERRWAAWAVALVLTFSPFALETSIIDPNFLASMFGTLALVLLLRKGQAPFAAGVAVSLFLGIRHVGLVCLPLVLLLLWRRGERPWRTLGAFLLGALIFGSPYIAIHIVRYVTVGELFEAAAPRAPAPHNFFGHIFYLRVLLNWPFVPEALRSPYTPFPTLALIPLDLVRRFGLVGIGLIPAGLAWLHRRDRLVTWLLVGWFTPLMLSLMLQSNWTEANKMGIMATVLAPLVVFMAAGAVAVVDRERPWWWRAGWLGAGVLTPLILVPLVHGWQAPKDTRVFNSVPDDYEVIMPEGTEMRFDEDPTYLDWERHRYALRPLPSVDWDKAHPVLWRTMWEQAADQARTPSVLAFEPSHAALVHEVAAGTMTYVGPLAQIRDAMCEEIDMADPRCAPDLAPSLTAGEQAMVWLDLEAPPALAEAPLVPASADAAGALELAPGVVYRIEDIPVSWADSPVKLIMARDEFNGVILAITPRVVPLAKVARRGMEVVDLSPSRVQDGRLLLQLPKERKIDMMDVRSAVPRRRYARLAVIEDDGVWLSTPTVYSR